MNFRKTEKFKSLDCCFTEKKVIIYFSYKIINIGHIDEKNIFYPELFIDSSLKSNLFSYFNVIKSKGFSIVFPFINDKEIIYQKSKYSTVKLKLYKFDDNEELDNNGQQFEEQKDHGENNNIIEEKNISEKLKELIIICFAIQRTEQNYWKLLEELEEVILIDKKIFEGVELNKLINLTKKVNIDKNKNLIDEIINKLDKNLLEKLDEELDKNYSYNLTKAKPKNLQVVGKNINLYEELIIINKKILDSFNFDIKNIIKDETISYYKYHQDDLIIINNKNQYSILIGKYDEKNYYYEINYILEYENLECFEDDTKYLLEKKTKYRTGVFSFIKENTKLDMNNENDIISPIFDDETIIGYCYVYDSSISDYTQYSNYVDFINDNKITNSIELYSNNYKIEENLNKKYNKNNKYEYALINNQKIEEIKDSINYNGIKNMLNLEQNYMTIQKEKNKKRKLYEIIKNSEYEELIKNLKNYKGIEPEFQVLIEPSIISVPFIDYEQNNKNVKIYDNYQLMDKETVDIFIQKEYSKNIIYCDCFFVERKIIINYPNNLDKSDKYVTVIGEIDYEGLFMTKYILIYDDKRERETHIQKIIYNLNNYLGELNGTAPIILEEKNYKIIGNIITYEANTSNNINIINNVENNNNHINNKINKNSNFENNHINNFDYNYNGNNNNNNIENNNNDNEEYEEEENIIRYKSIKEQFEIHPLIGLENIGATCYMNATLQCLCNIQKFVDFFKYSPHALSIYNSSPNTLSHSFKLLIDNLWPDNFDKNNTNKSYYAPRDFKAKISKMNSLFEGVAANDAKDLVNFIIMTLHEELNAAKKDVINENNLIDQSDKQKVFNSFMKEFTQKNQSIISDLFYSTNLSITECSNCHISLYNYQIYFFIVFPLEEIRKYKLSQINNNMVMNMNMNMNMNINFMNNNNMVMFNNFFMNNNNNINNMNNELNIYDCFNYETKQNIMSGSNAMYCNRCNCTHDCYMRTRLITGPEIFILLLNRGKGKQFDVKLNFVEYLDLKNYIEYYQTGYYYKLIGVITHIGGNGMDGHFIAYCRDPLTDKWHKFNDAIVTEVTNFQKQVIDFAMPYLLFYQKQM